MAGERLTTVTPCLRTSSGKVAWARLTLLLTLTRAMLASLPSLKYTLMLPEPEPEAAMEVM